MCNSALMQHVPCLSPARQPNQRYQNHATLQTRTRMHEAQCGAACELWTEDLGSKKPRSWDIGLADFSPSSWQESSGQASSGHLDWVR